ncbi:MAG: PEPxxWA-CTERM sorting domain-containing protein, partial [Pseudomonadota bacterium]|nr:PEPxxWA-CTERM sorting domain-containing protein [Pseudomonadota bacterium]
GPTNGNLMTAGTHHFYGEVKYTLRDDLGAVRIIAPSTHASLILTPIPEPETWAMLLAGLGLTGLWLRQHQQTR